MDFLPDSDEHDRRESGAKMTKRTRRNHSPAFKAKVALADLKGKKKLAELSQQFDVHPTRSHNGNVSFSKEPSAFSVKTRARRAPRSI